MSSTDSIRRPAGGFAFISVEQLCAAWAAYSLKRIQLVDLRMWLACWEMKSRRCRVARGARKSFGVDELHRLVGGAGGLHIRASLRRLEQIGLLEWSENHIHFDVPSDGDIKSRADAMCTQIVNAGRRVPVPRRMIRYLARRGTRSLIATVIGHLLRCMYYRGGQCASRGACKASWVSAVFGVDVRNVKGARAELARIGWLAINDAPQWRLNRFGAVAVINLAWGEGRPAAPTSDPSSELPPPPARTLTESPPPESDKKLLSEYKNQKPAMRGPSGVWKGSRPRLTNIQAADLRSISRLLALHEQAVRAGFARDGEAGKLEFLAAAVHSLSIGARNPEGLFATIVRKGLWAYVTQADEDRARCRLNSFRARRGKLSHAQLRLTGEGAHNREQRSCHTPLRVSSLVELLSVSLTESLALT